MATKTRGYEVIKWVNSDQSEWSKLQKSTYRQMKNTVKNLEPSNVAAGEGSMIYVSKKNARDFISVNSVLNDLKESGDRYYLLMKAQLHTGARVGDLSSLKLLKLLTIILLRLNSIYLQLQQMLVLLKQIKILLVI